MAKSQRERFIEAKKLIEKKGWCQGSKVFDLKRKHGYCVATALGKVCDAERIYALDDIRFLHKANKLPRPSSGIGPWNDAPDRTKEQVLAAFDKAIEAST